MYAIKYFTDLYDINTPVIYNNYICIQLCLKINILIYDKKSFEVVKNNNNITFTQDPPKKKKKLNEKQEKEEKYNKKFNILYNLDKNI